MVAIIPWTSWLQTGDTSVIDEKSQAMRKYVDAIDARNPDGIWHNDSGIPFGDWLSLEGRTLEDLIATAYWAYDVNMLRQMAHATGRAEEEQRYSNLEAKIRDAFQKKFGMRMRTSRCGLQSIAIVTSIIPMRSQQGAIHRRHTCWRCI